MNFKKLLEKKIARQAEIAAAAKNEQRSLTDVEKAEFDMLQRDIDELKSMETAAPEVDDAQTERQRTTDIYALCREFDVDATDYIKNGDSVDTVRAAILDEMRKNKAPVGNLKVITDEADKTRAAMADGLAMRSGVKLEHPADGANQFRAMSLRDMAIECLSRENDYTETELMRKSSGEVYDILCRQFLSPTAAFPAILDDAINKKIVEAYNLVPTTFEQWVDIGSVSDFKETKDHSYLIGGGSEFELVPEGGELKHDQLRDYKLPTKKIETYGKQFTMDRRAFINDDIGYIMQIPAQAAANAKRTINNQVYRLLVNNGTIFDGNNLFGEAHGNHITSGGAPSVNTIEAMILMMQTQTDPFGRAINVTPEYIIVPVGYEFTLRTIFTSAGLPGTANNDINPLKDYPIKWIQAPELNVLAGAGQAVPWFMVANKASARSIGVDYLNNQQMPSIRRMEYPGQLGFIWDIWLDWGVNVRDWRGIARNNGAVIA